MADLHITLTATIDRDDIPNAAGRTGADLHDAVADVLEQDTEIAGVAIWDITVEVCDA